MRRSHIRLAARNFCIRSHSCQWVVRTPFFRPRPFLLILAAPVAQVVVVSCTSELLYSNSVFVVVFEFDSFDWILNSLFLLFVLCKYLARLSSDSSAKGAAELIGRPDNKRGALRLRRERNELLRTRPPTVETKSGSSGTPVTLQANYFRFQRRPNWQIYRYHVEFKPDVLSEKLRKALIFSQKEMLGGYLFDGTQLFLTRKLESEVVEKTVTGRIDNVAYLLIIKFTGEVSMSESTSLQILK